MCGIAGVKKYGDTPINEEEIAILLCSLEKRGNHASGLALVDETGTKISVHKMPEPPWSFMAHASTKAFLKEFLTNGTSIALIHNRAATVGNPYENKNNHPMFDGKAAIVHNGGIRNHDTLFKSEGLSPTCDTDSDYIRAVFDREGFTEKAVRLLSKAYGSAGLAAVHPEFPGVLALGRSGNPLVVADYNDKLYFASELQAIHKAVRPWTNRHGLWMRESTANFAYNNLVDDTMYFLHPDGQSTHHEMKINTGTFVSPVYRSHETYGDKMKVWRASAKKDREFTRCKECGTLQSRSIHTPWTNLVCCEKDCKARLNYLDAEFEKTPVTA